MWWGVAGLIRTELLMCKAVEATHDDNGGWRVKGAVERRTLAVALTSASEKAQT